MLENPIPNAYHSDHLFLLIGTNPLPNYVAAMLLTHETSTIYLLHSDGTSGISTKPFATFLQDVLKTQKPGVTIIPRGIHDTNGTLIERQLQTILNDANLPISIKVGLNYTGGTKAMSVHTYRFLAAQLPQTTFSYLDAHKLTLHIDGVAAYPVGHSLTVSLSELAALHGYELGSLRQESQHKVLVQALAQVHTSSQEYQQWKKWLNKQPLTDLPEMTDAPALRRIRQAMDTLCGGQATPELFVEKMGFPGRKLESCRKWFMGTWLEELALDAIASNAAALDLRHYGIGLHPMPKQIDDKGAWPRKEFDLDVAVLYGYQLFVVSCIRSQDEEGETKRHLFEAYLRAKQLGGDEAKVALLSLVDHPIRVETEIQREWLAAGQIRVFGRNDLLSLTTTFHAWLQKPGG